MIGQGESDFFFSAQNSMNFNNSDGSRRKKSSNNYDLGDIIIKEQVLEDSSKILGEKEI